MTNLRGGGIRTPVPHLDPRLIHVDVLLSDATVCLIKSLMACCRCGCPRALHVYVIRCLSWNKRINLTRSIFVFVTIKQTPSEKRTTSNNAVICNARRSPGNIRMRSQISIDNKIKLIQILNYRVSSHKTQILNIMIEIYFYIQ